MFALPCLVHLKRLRAAGRLGPAAIAAHSLIILLGFANFFAQFTMLV